MLIGLCGGICSGKNSVAEYLIQKHGFHQLQLSHRPNHLLGQNELPPSFGSQGPKNGAHVFQTVDELLDFVTRRWQDRWVTTDIWDEATLERLLMRPYFLLVSVDAPVSLRWSRFSERAWRRQLDPPDLEKFVLWNDKHLYDKDIGITYMTDRAQLRLFNSSSSLHDFHSALEELDLADERRLRPGWDQYFMQLASLAAQRSNCMKRRVGCVLVRGRRVMSTGYNGTPRNTKNCNEGGCPRCNCGEGGGAALSTCLCIHAEENALLEAGRERIGEGATLYCNTCPCLTCSVKIAQLGISEVVYSQSYNMDNETASILKEAGVKLRQFLPPRNGLVYLQRSSIMISNDHEVFNPELAL
ncbi:deoxycytidylate deaminase [Histoplasma capsulatum var. duboisii H88]|uniref:Deoxycytidylate deaminase n=1 Tax=Ajellomyces capsulatus (strain H88) TaxID=544711 RepID=F0US54_AJEC8|nr:deoxycytidylate deaminase [Histoplasma capsulatum var. duboisii H88]